MAEHNLPNKKYDIIYADPPWKYDYASKAKSVDIERNYPTMDIEDICAIPVGDICSKNCMLYLWATAPKLIEAFKVMNAWGFKYVTNWVWDKKSSSMGYWSKVRHEQLLLGRKGKVSPPEACNRIDSIIRSKKTSKHSEKPRLHFIIDSYHPDVNNKIELFARNRDLFMSDWDVWGNEV